MYDTYVLSAGGDVDFSQRGLGVQPPLDNRPQKGGVSVGSSIRVLVSSAQTADTSVNAHTAVGLTPLSRCFNAGKFNAGDALGKRPDAGEGGQDV